LVANLTDFMHITQLGVPEPPLGFAFVVMHWLAWRFFYAGGEVEF